MFAVIRRGRVLETFHGRLAAEAYAKGCDSVVETNKPVKPGDKSSKCR